MSRRRIRTVGHSDRTQEEFIGLLREAHVDLVVDVRRLPGSRRNPQFNEDQLRDGLAAAGIDYLRLPGLAGRRGRAHEVPPEVNGYWHNQSFHNYADHTRSAQFQSDLDRLRRLASDHVVTVLCSEAVWWRCHRRLIADALLARGDEVLHLMGAGREAPADLTPGAVIGPDETVSYPASPGADG